MTLRKGYTIKPGHVVEFDPGKSTTVEASGNILVYGTLRMRPRSDGITHTLRFVNIHEGAFVGGGMDPIPSDVGLWVMKAGKLEAKGARKVPWMRAEAVSAGATELHLSSDPTGWRKGDEVAITPTLPPTDPAFATSEVARIQSVQGRTVVLASAVSYAHPSVSGPLGEFGPEILNVTRNVRIEGTPGGRSHMFLRPNRPQTISNVAVRYMGPRKNGHSVLGRYGIHFHMAEDGTRGSTLTGVVVRDCNSHAFVPHFSFGITFRECISFNTVSDAYWWDRVPQTCPGRPTSTTTPTRNPRTSSTNDVWRQTYAGSILTSRTGSLDSP